MNNDNLTDVHKIGPVVFVYYYVKADCIQYDGYYPANDNVNVNANENVNVNDCHSNSRPNRSDYCDMRLELFVWALMVVYVAMTHYTFALYFHKPNKRQKIRGNNIKIAFCLWILR